MSRFTLIPSGAKLAAIATVLALAATVPLGSVGVAQDGASSSCPTWSGGSLIFCAGSDGRTELFEQKTDGSVRQLTYLGGSVDSPDVSEDGRLVTFEATHEVGADPQVYVIARYGPRLRVAVVGPNVIELGKRIVLLGGHHIEVDGARAIRLTSAGSNFDPSFAPTDDQISFTSDRTGFPTLWSMDIDGSGQREMLLASNE